MGLAAKFEWKYGVTHLLGIAYRLIQTLVYT